jgi:hypothetical protein
LAVAALSSAPKDAGGEHWRYKEVTTMMLVFNNTHPFFDTSHLKRGDPSI